MSGLSVPSTLHEGPGRTHDGKAWLGRLPDLVERARVRWDLRLGEPFTTGAAAWAAPADLPDGTTAVLKISFQHDEARYEAIALRAWHGRGVPLLIDENQQDWALLLERVEPGTPLAHAPLGVGERLAIAVDVQRQLLDAPEPADVPDMGKVCAGWASLLEERAERWGGRGAHPEHLELVQGAAGLLRSLPTSDHPRVVVHGDLNPGNVLRARDRWVAIDPKPMRGDAAYDLWPLLEQLEDPFATADPATTLHDRVTLVAHRSGLDLQRIAAWGWARGAEYALWMAEEQQDDAAATRALDRVAVWARLAA